MLYRLPNFFCLVALLSIATASSATTADYEAVVQDLGLAEVSATLSDEQVNTFADKVSNPSQALAFLSAIGVDAEADTEEIVKSLELDPIFIKATKAEELAAGHAEGKSKGLEKILQNGMTAGVNTGYNIIPIGAWPKYDPSRTIIYGHNQIKHMRQLLFLLKVHGLEPEFEIVPKRSAFKLREGWGNITETTPRLSDGTPVAIISEYDLLMEFGTPEQVIQFQDLVTRYAKKDAEDEEGLIYKSWWQPFYRSFVKAGSMQRTREIWVSKDGFRANVLSIPEQAAEKEKSLRELSDAWSLEVIDLWVNPSFYRYLLGDYK